MPSWSTQSSVSQRLSSDPLTMSNGPEGTVGSAYSLIVPVVVTLATLLAHCSTNHRLLSDPTVMPHAKLSGSASVYSVKVPVVVTLLTFPLASVYHRLPSGPR